MGWDGLDGVVDWGAEGGLYVITLGLCVSGTPHQQLDVEPL